MRRLVPLALAAIVASLAVASSAGAQPAYPLELFYGQIGSIGSERIAIRKRYVRELAIDRYVLELTLDELRPNGDEIFLGMQQLPLADTTFVSEGIPTPRHALVDVDWTTVPLQADSDVRACLQLYRLRRDGSLAPRGDIECREITPVDPL